MHKQNDLNIDLRFFLYKDFLDQFKPQWNSLLIEINGAPDLSHEWLEAVICSQRITYSSIYIIAGFRGNELTLIWPYIKKIKIQRGIPYIAITPLQSIYSLHHLLITKDSYKEAIRLILDFFKETEPNYGLIEFNRITEGSDFCNALQNIEDTQVKTIYGAKPPYLSVNSTWEEFLSSKSSNFRSNLKRKIKKLECSGIVEYLRLTEKEKIISSFDSIYLIEKNSWKAKEGTAIINRQWEWTFYQKLMVNIGSGWNAILTFVIFNNVPIAYDLSLIGSDKAYCLKTSFDSNYEKLSPGYALRANLMKYIFSLGLKEYDFLGNNERYKLEWTQTVRKDLDFVLFNKGSWFKNILRTLRYYLF